MAAQKDNEQRGPGETLAVPTNHPLSIFDPTSFPTAYTQFLFGDCASFLKLRRTFQVGSLGVQSHNFWGC